MENKLLLNWNKRGIWDIKESATVNISGATSPKNLKKTTSAKIFTGTELDGKDRSLTLSVKDMPAIDPPRPLDLQALKRKLLHPFNKQINDDPYKMPSPTSPQHSRSPNGSNSFLQLSKIQNNVSIDVKLSPKKDNLVTEGKLTSPKKITVAVTPTYKPRPIERIGEKRATLLETSATSPSIASSKARVATAPQSLQSSAQKKLETILRKK